MEEKVDWKGRPTKKGVHGGILPALFILVMFAFNSCAWVALAGNLVMYFTGVLHLDLASASNSVTNFMGTTYILAQIAAYLADAHVGRCKIVLISGFIEFLALLLLAVQAHIPSLKPQPCDIYDVKSQCEKIHGGNAAFFYIALYSVAVGLAGIFAGLPSHGADQFDDKDPKELRHMSSFFNYLTASNAIGSILSLTLVVWIQTHVGWDWGFGTSAACVFVATLIFAVGVPKYRIHVIGGPNPIVQIFQVLVAAVRNWRLPLPKDSAELYEIKNENGEEFLPHRDIFRFLDKAAILRKKTNMNSETDKKANQWELCRVTQVENAKTIVGMLPIFICSIFMSTCLAQLQTFTIQQGFTMDNKLGKHIHIAPANLAIAPMIFMLVGIPIYDRLVVPLLRRITGHPKGISDLKRIGIGLLLSCVAMIVGAIVEIKRKHVAKSHGMIDANPLVNKLPISIFWLAIQHFTFGISDMFTYVGLMEFFYSEAPKPMKSIASSLLWCSLGLGYFLSSILVDIVNHATRNNTKSGGWLAGNNLNRNHVDLFFWTLAILTFINLLHYLYWAGRYEYKSQPLHNASKVEVSQPQDCV
ncbi:Proton-dependent oligopeptide transporter family protein [Dioscorea alata]|uniref:Proton-dependent oligopeptide transporter family protein n=1 Tax=Dioscorea alata TaxID=55571 RepID=A0ACB7UBR7_DIOAL|nr:Proton-dependent oligopeptide transporter family protein [Dioscorea alata]